MVFFVRLGVEVESVLAALAVVVFCLACFKYGLSLMIIYFNHLVLHSQHRFCYLYSDSQSLESYSCRPFISYQTHHTNFYPAKHIYCSLMSFGKVKYYIICIDKLEYLIRKSTYLYYNYNTIQSICKNKRDI